jgi:hypothetical protein
LTKSITQPAQYGSFFFTHVNRLNYYLRWVGHNVQKEGWSVLSLS